MNTTFSISGILVAAITVASLLSRAAEAQPPTVNAIIVNPTPIRVAVDGASPVTLTNNDEPGRQPYVASMGFSQFGCFTLQCTNFVKSGGAILFDGPEVPAGKRLVIQYVSGRIPQAAGTDVSVALQTEQVLSQFSVIWGFYGPFFTQSTLQGFSSPAFATYGPGERPHVHIIAPDPNNFVGLVNLSGYLIDAD